MQLGWIPTYLSCEKLKRFCALSHDSRKRQRQKPSPEAHSCCAGATPDSRARLPSIENTVIGGSRTGVVSSAARRDDARNAPAHIRQCGATRKPEGQQLVCRSPQAVCHSPRASHPDHEAGPSGRTSRVGLRRSAYYPRPTAWQTRIVSEGSQHADLRNRRPAPFEAHSGSACDA